MGGIRARLRFGQREGGQLLPLGQVRQPAPLLLLGAKDDDGLGAHRVVDVEDDRGAGAEAGDFLDEDREGYMVEAGTAIGVGHQDAEQPEPGSLVDQVAGELAVVVDRLGARLHLTLGEFPHERAHLLLFGAEGKIH